MKLFFCLLLLSSSALAAPSKNPEDTALAFYDSYLKYQASLEGKSRSPKEVELGDREATKNYLTAGFWRTLVAQKKKCAAAKDDVPEGCDSDPFYCAQEAPTGAKIDRAENVKASLFTGKTAKVPVALCFNCGSASKQEAHETVVAQVHLRKTIGNWLIEKIDCPTPK